MQDKEEVEVEYVPPDEVVVEERKQSLEHDVLSRDTVKLKNICGVMIVATMCIVTLVLAMAVYENVSQGREWPDRTTIFIIVSPLGLMGWAYMNVNSTIRMLARLPGALVEAREKMSEVIRPKKP